MLPEELKKLIEERDEDDILIFINRVNYCQSEPEVELTITTNDYEGEEIKQTWLLTIRKHQGSQVLSAAASHLAIHDTHPLLLKYKDQHALLYFSGQCADPYKLFVDLFDAHLAICDTFVPFTQYLNNQKDLMAVLKTSSALLAQGPVKVLKQYAECLEQHHLTYKFIANWLPNNWNGKPYAEINPDIKLLLLDDSYFMGEEFVFTKR